MKLNSFEFYMVFLKWISCEIHFYCLFHMEIYMLVSNENQVSFHDQNSCILSWHLCFHKHFTFYFLQIHCATFNKTYGKANLGEGNSGLFKQRVLISPFEALLKLYCFSLETVFLRLAILANGPFVPIMISVC